MQISAMARAHAVIKDDDSVLNGVIVKIKISLKSMSGDGVEDIRFFMQTVKSLCGKIKDRTKNLLTGKHLCSICLFDLLFKNQDAHPFFFGIIENSSILFYHGIMKNARGFCQSFRITAVDLLA
jgi:hypothetical protein